MKYWISRGPRRKKCNSHFLRSFLLLPSHEWGGLRHRCARHTLAKFMTARPMCILYLLVTGRDGSSMDLSSWKFAAGGLFFLLFFTLDSLFFILFLLLAPSNTLLMRMRFVFWIIESVGDQGKRERFWRVSWIIRNSFKLQKIISRKKIKFSYVCLQSALQFFRYLNTVCNCSITDSMRNERGWRKLN